MKMGLCHVGGAILLDRPVCHPSTVVQVALTDYASCACESTGQVTCWGDRAYVPTAPSNVNFDFIDAHGDTICGITRDREIGAVGLWKHRLG